MFITLVENGNIGVRTMCKRCAQPNVFVVDDEEIIASTVAGILNMRGKFHAKAFTKPLEALSAARVEAPDLLITDVAMPLLSGNRARNPGARILPGLQNSLVFGTGVCGSHAS